ncbi:HINT domain-containing protein [Micromonospora yasonensis]|uniref:HINT domain-containing protein n=1 Tax=Micromonospora yasonensis TaxID=1128667 RepID=UPI00222EE50E|nr:HINT domain-containing protein [Micromonospora yasonensis]MCW3844736.1 HINT domain-containing protein [Micromonospora yasonensis]
MSQFLTPDHYNDVQADLRLGPVPFDTAASNSLDFWEWAKGAGRSFVNHVKEDPWQFAGEVAIGIAAAAAVGLVCATGIGCAILAGIAGGAASAAYGYGVDVAQGEHSFDAGDFTEQTLIGAGIGGATAGIGYGIGRGLSKLFKKSKMPTSCHSFAAGTLVLMADGTTKRIEDIKIGDVVLATDPETGLTVAKRVTYLHLNQDWDLAEVTVHDSVTGETEVLKTTWHHPFWNASEDAWVDAADLKPGTWLRDDEGKETQQVVAVRTWTGLQQMHDLTIADIHTYYVVAGTTPVLVHNNNGCVEVTANDNSYSISHAKSGSGVIADLDSDGIITLMMQRNGGSPMSGREMFDRVMAHFGDRVNGIQGYWVYGDNLAAFNAAVRNGDPLRSAARGTWTGRQAARYGFTRVKILIADENLDGFTKVSAMFRRERG